MFATLPRRGEIVDNLETVEPGAIRSQGGVDGAADRPARRRRARFSRKFSRKRPCATCCRAAPLPRSHVAGYDAMDPAGRMMPRWRACRACPCGRGVAWSDFPTGVSVSAEDHACRFAARPCTSGPSCLAGNHGCGRRALEIAPARRRMATATMRPPTRWPTCARCSGAARKPWLCACWQASGHSGRPASCWATSRHRQCRHHGHSHGRGAPVRTAW